MQLSRRLVKQLVQRSAWFCLVISGLLSLQALGQSRAGAGNTSPGIAPASPEHDPLVVAAFEHFYDMEYDRSIQEFEKVVERRPNDPPPANHLMIAVLVR